MIVQKRPHILCGVKLMMDWMNQTSWEIILSEEEASALILGIKLNIKFHFQMITFVVSKIILLCTEITI